MKLREPMPELSGATEWLNGKVTKEQLIGEKPTLLHFWSISCHVCKEAMPQVNQSRDHYRAKINIVAIHMPILEDNLNIVDIEKIATEHSIFHPIFVDSKKKLTNAFENKYVPAYYLFDKEGKLRHFQAGASGMRMLEERVSRIVSVY